MKQGGIFSDKGMYVTRITQRNIRVKLSARLLAASAAARASDQSVYGLNARKR